MASTVTSRFSFLNIEKDDYQPKLPPKLPVPASKTNPTNKKKANGKAESNTTLRKSSTDSSKKAKSKKLAKVPNGDVTNVGTTALSSQQVNGAKGSSKKVKKPAGAVNQSGVLPNHHQSNHNMNKLQYNSSNQASNGSTSKKQGPPGNNAVTGKKNKNKKPNLANDQYNKLYEQVKQLDHFPKSSILTESQMKFEYHEGFSAEIKMRMQNELFKERAPSHVAKRGNNPTTIAQCHAELKRLEEENLMLRRNMELAKLEIASVTKRNRLYGELFTQGEMRDKADLLQELKQYKTIQHELTSALARLCQQLEEERVKVDSLTRKQAQAQLMMPRATKTCQKNLNTNR